MVQHVENKPTHFGFKLWCVTYPRVGTAIITTDAEKLLEQPCNTTVCLPHHLPGPLQDLNARTLYQWSLQSLLYIGSCSFVAKIEEGWQSLLHVQVCQQCIVRRLQLRLENKERTKMISKALLSLWWQSWTSLMSPPSIPIIVSTKTCPTAPQAVCKWLNSLLHQPLSYFDFFLPGRHLLYHQTGFTRKQLQQSITQLD